MTVTNHLSMTRTDCTDETILESDYASPVGTLTIVCSKTALRSIRFSGEQTGWSLAMSSLADDNPVIMAVRNWLDAYFAGENPPPGSIPIDAQGTPFMHAVWQLAAKIPYGQTASYGELARKITEAGEKQAMCGQAIGCALAKNPVPIIIACHRVIAADGKLAGYTGGLKAKMWLLDHESGQKNCFDLMEE